MRIRRFKKLGSLSLSALLIGSSFLPGVPMKVLASENGSVVISEVYGGGGNSGATYKNDFIELYNPTMQDVNIDGWSVQYASSTGTFNQGTNLSGIVKAHSYYLVQEAKGTGGTIDLPNPDATGSLNMSASKGRVALSKSSTFISGVADSNVVDYIGFGSSTEYEGSNPAPTLSNSQSAERRANDGTDPTKEGAGNGNGWDTNDNGADFVLADPNPQNSSSAPEPEIIVPDPPSEGVTFIHNVRENDSSGQPTLLGQTVTVEGTVTVGNNIIGTKTFYIQDDTGGINVFNSTQEVTVGSKVKVTGVVSFYKGLTEIEPVSIEVTGDGKNITPKESQIAEFSNYSTAEPLEGMLVKVRGKVTNVPETASGGGYNITLTDDTGKATTLRVMTSTGIDTLNNIKKDSYYDITGIVGQYDSSSPYDSGYQIFPRNTSDIQEYFALSLQHDPITTAYVGTDVQFVANSTGADTITVYFKDSATSSYQTLQMVKSVENEYTAVLPAAQLSLSGFYYYIEAKNQSEAKTVGSADSPYFVQVKTDTEGPDITGFQPANQSIVETYTPEISFQWDDPSGIDTAKLSLKFDDIEVASQAVVSSNQVHYQPSEKLIVGHHTVVVTAFDKKGNTSNATWSFDVAEPFTGGNHYRGTTHNHTNISHDAAGTPEDALKAGKAHGYDWFAFSDHSHDIDAVLADKDTVDHNGMPERTGGDNWKLTKDLATKYTKDNEFVVFPAFEMTSTTWGHSNVFGTDNFIDRKMNSGKYQDLNQYYAWVLTYDDIAAQFNHPDMSANAFNNFMPYDQRVDKLFTMLEVGNGSGSYSYANAEKKFYSALDLGWHVAPTYGEDNHDATWGQTMKRTVIVSKDLSQASLLHSMRNMRVYMEEDPNFTLDVLANGQYMGSVVDSKTLSFDIKGSDTIAESNSIPEYNYLPSSYHSDDRIQKVELLTNGAKVVDSIEPNTKDFTWKPTVTVTGGQQWFVVKVTQMDGERIYSSPIWTKEEPVDVRISGIDVVGGALVSGSPATLAAGVSNLGNTDLTNLKVSFYDDAVNEQNLIGQSVLAKVSAKSVGQVSIVWSNPIGGSHKLIAVVSTPNGDNPADNQYEKQVIIKQALGITVMIDAAHKNENTSTDPGTYKNNFTSFTRLIQQEGYNVVENKQPLTTDLLKDVKVLVMTHPQVDLTETENRAVSTFVKNGGSLLLTDKSNFKNDTTINNDLLQEMGSTIQINNDGINDDTKEGNFWSDPLKSKFAVRLHLHPVENFITDRADTVEYYSGSSLEKIGYQALTDSDTVTILANGNETTYQGSVAPGNYVYDDVSDETGGSDIPAVASETIGNGKIIVSGMNFMNDKQLDESYNPKGNDEFALNSVNWLADRGTTVTKISDARSLDDGTSVVVQGTVTTGAGIFYDAFYLQDDTGGIMAFHDVPDGSLKPGDIVRVYGNMKTFENNRELEFADFAKDVIKVGEKDAIQPKELTTGAANEEQNQGLLVKVTGKVITKYDDNSYVIDDGTGEVLIFTDGYIVAQSGPVPSLNIGDTLEAVGLTGKYAEGNRIRVRDTRELVKKDVTAPVSTAESIPTSPTGKNGWYTESVTINLHAEDDMSGVKDIQYNLNNSGWVKYTAPIQLDKDGIFTIQYRSEDNAGNIEETQSLEVKIDMTAPVLNVSVDNPILRVPNHKLVDIKATIDSSDETSDIESILLESITVNETNASLDDIQEADYGTFDTEFKLRSERNGFDDGRVYTITYLATDKAGNTTRATATVTVPKGNSDKLLK